MLAVALLAIGTLQSGQGDHSTPAPVESWTRAPGSDRAVPDPPFTVVNAGDPAPDFSFEARDHRWRRLHDLLVQGDVLLVFGADDARLNSIESERDALLAHGIVPVAVLDRRDGAAWATPDRLRLHYGVVPDARGVIAEQFNLVNPETGRPYPSWFLVDHAGKVRALHRGALPEQGFTAAAERALGLPEQGQPIPAGAR
jgi:peroxiredoxin